MFKAEYAQSDRESRPRGRSRSKALHQRLKTARGGRRGILLEIQRVDARRGALARRAMFLESFPESEPRGITARIGDAVRGS